MDASFIVGLFLVILIIQVIICAVMYLLSKDIIALHEFIASFLDDMLRIENEKLEIVKNRREQ